MRLSEAIMLGRHTIQSPECGNINACAIPMALNSVGRDLLYCEDGNLPYATITEQWPWLEEIADNGGGVKCPCCPSVLGYSEIVWHPFDCHVMGNFPNYPRLTLEQMCDWIRSIEPAEEPEAYQGDAGDETEPKCSVCSVPLYLHNEFCESEDYDPAMVSRERERGLAR